MTKIFATKNFIIVEIVILGLTIVAWSMKYKGLFQEWLGNCTPPCPPGVACALEVIFCSQVTGRIGYAVLPWIFIVYLVGFVIYKLSQRSKF